MPLLTNYSLTKRASNYM